MCDVPLEHRLYLLAVLPLHLLSGATAFAGVAGDAAVEAGVLGDKLYLLLANHTHNSQTHLTQAEVTLEYDDGDKVRVPLNGPHDVDGMLQHYSDMAPEWIGGIEGGWYGHGRASGVHADVVDIELDGSRTLAAFEVRCVTEETLIGLLGATVHSVVAE